MGGHGIDAAADLQPPHHRAEQARGPARVRPDPGRDDAREDWLAGRDLPRRPQGPRRRLREPHHEVAVEAVAVRGEQDAETRALPRIFLETSDMSTFAGHLRGRPRGASLDCGACTPPSAYSNSKSSSASAPISRKARSSASKIASASGTLDQSALSVP